MPSPKKLLHSKWTAVDPKRKEKHFVVTGLVEPDPPGSALVSVELEAVHSRRVYLLPWRELYDERRWRQGWIS